MLAPKIEGCAALLWVKPPYESDASVINAGSANPVANSAPPAGSFWRTAALALAKAAVPPL